MDSVYDFAFEVGLGVKLAWSNSRDCFGSKRSDGRVDPRSAEVPC